MSCRLALCYDSPRLAAAVAGSLRPDDDLFVETTAEGATVVAMLRAGSVMSMAAALDDLLACAAEAERVARQVTDEKR